MDIAWSDDQALTRAFSSQRFGRRPGLSWPLDIAFLFHMLYQLVGTTYGHTARVSSGNVARKPRGLDDDEW